MNDDLEPIESRPRFGIYSFTPVEAPPPVDPSDCSGGGQFRVHSDGPLKGRWMEGPCRGQPATFVQSDAAAEAAEVGGNSHKVQVEAPFAESLEAVQLFPLPGSTAGSAAGMGGLTPVTTLGDTPFVKIQATKVADGIFEYETSGVDPETGLGVSTAWVRHWATYPNGTVIREPLAKIPNASAPESKAGFRVGDARLRKVTGNRVGALRRLKPGAFANVAEADVAPEAPAVELDEAVVEDAAVQLNYDGTPVNLPMDAPRYGVWAGAGALTLGAAWGVSKLMRKRGRRAVRRRRSPRSSRRW